MSQDEPSDLSLLDTLFSRYGQGGSSARALSDERKKQIYAGHTQEAEEASNPTHKTLKAILDYEETIPDREVDEFVSKIRDTRLLDDYPEDSLEPTTPAFNPWPLDEDASSSVMADPLSGEIVVTDLQSKAKPEEDGTLDATNDDDKNSPASSGESDIDDEEPEDLTPEFEKDTGAAESSDLHGDEDAQHNDDGKEVIIPRIDDDEGDAEKDKSVKMEELEEEDEEEEEADKDEEDGDKNDSNDDIKGIDEDSRTSPVEIKVDLCEETLEKSDDSGDMTTIDGKSPHPEVQANEGNKSEEKPQEKKKENVPDFETFLAELGFDPKETLDNDAQKSRARLSRLGPMAQRRPMTKRFSAGDEEKWMFADSTEPRAQRPSIDEEDEEEEEEEVKIAVKAPAPSSKPGMKKPAGGIGLGPMVLPGLGAALGGSKLKKTPTSTPNKTFQKSVEESKVTPSKSEQTKSSPLSFLKKTPPSKAPAQATKAPPTASQAPPPASKVTPTTALKPQLNKPKPLSKPRPGAPDAPVKEPSQPAWLKELKSKPKPEPKETKKEEDKLNSDILNPKTSPSEAAPKTPSWMANSKTKKLPPIPSSSSSPKQEAETSTPSVPQWKQELMKKKKAPPPPPTTNKPPLKTQILPKSPTKSPGKPSVSPSKPAVSAAKPAVPLAKPQIARKPGFTTQGDSIDKGTPKPSIKHSANISESNSLDKDNSKPSKLGDFEKDSNKSSKPVSIETSTARSAPKDSTDNATPEQRIEEKAKSSVPQSKDEDAPKPSEPATHEKVSDLKRADESKDESDSKKIKLSQSMDSTLDEEKMEVTLDVTPEKTSDLTPEKTPEDDAEKEDNRGEEWEKKQGEEEEEVKKVKTEEKKVIILTKTETEKVQTKAAKAEERKVTIVTKNSKESLEEKQGEGKCKKGEVNSEMKKDEGKVEKPVIIIPKSDKPKVEETNKIKSVTITNKADTKKEELLEGKQEEKKVTLVMKPESKPDEPKKTEQKKVTIVTKPEDKNAGADLGSMPKWKREAMERKQKRKMSGGTIVPMRSPRDTIETNGNNNTPQWKKDLVEKRKMLPKMPSLDSEEKGSVESQKSEKVQKRHTIAADVPTITVPAGHKTGMPSWKQELEKKNARLAKHLATKDAGSEIKSPIEGVTQQPVPELS